MGCAEGQKAILAPENMPPFSDEQLAYLNALYPEACPDVTDTEREIWMAVGARRVVKRLHTDEARRQERQRKSTRTSK